MPKIEILSSFPAYRIVASGQYAHVRFATEKLQLMSVNRVENHSSCGGGFCPCNGDYSAFAHVIALTAADDIYRHMSFIVYLIYVRKNGNNVCYAVVFLIGGIILCCAELMYAVGLIFFVIFKRCGFIS